VAHLSISPLLAASSSFSPVLLRLLDAGADDMDMECCGDCGDRYCIKISDVVFCDESRKSAANIIFRLQILLAPKTAISLGQIIVHKMARVPLSRKVSLQTQRCVVRMRAKAASMPRICAHNAVRKSEECSVVKKKRHELRRGWSAQKQEVS